MTATLVTQEDINDALSRPPDYAYFGDNEDMFVAWGICGLSKHRDSDPLQISNYETVFSDLTERFPDDIYDIHSNHWAVGWIDQMVVRVIDDNGNPTKCFEALLEWRNRLADYPIADEEDYSRREWEDFHETLKKCYYPTFFRHPNTNEYYEPVDDYPDDWVDQLAQYLQNNYAVINSAELSWLIVCEAHIELGFVEKV